VLTCRLFFIRRPTHTRAQSLVSTLGIVELVVWLLQSYASSIYYTDQKAVFAKVHFALFYTAVFNAGQTALVAFFAGRHSAFEWVKTEMCELNHYVEIREEFDRVRTKLGELEMGWLGRLRHPKLQHKYNRLLVQVRFHELRVHFLQAYDLPLKLKVSDYLMRSELSVLMRLVSVSLVAWLMLTGVFNLVYFMMGAIAYYTNDVQLIGTILTWIVLGSMAAFVLFGLLLYCKMKSVFSSIMHQNRLWNKQEDEKDDLIKEQLALFWSSDPRLVIASIQFMQFGYAVILSAVFIFWDTIALGMVDPGWYIFVIVVAYSIFASVVARIIPWYTLCTSLGQLVDKQRLQETVAAFRLEEARRSELEKSERQSERILASVPIISGVKTLTPSSSFAALDSVTTMSNQENAELIAELVKLDTDSLRENIPESVARALERRDQEKKNRKKSSSDGVNTMAKMYRNSISSPKRADRVKDDLDVSKALKATNNDSPGAFEELRPDDTTEESIRHRRHSRRMRMKSVSDGVALMASVKPLSTQGVIPAPVPEDTIVEATEMSSITPVALNRIMNPPPSASVPNRLDESLGDLSDVGDIPDAQEADSTVEIDRPSLLERLRRYYLSRRFVLISHIFGTLVAFFMVGQRVSGFLTDELNANGNDFAVFAFPTFVTFWILFAWLSLFITNSGLVFYAFRGFGSSESNKERQVVIAAVFDIIISGVCLLVLCIAEAQRCCIPKDDPVGDVEYDYGRRQASCSCPSFGFRMYGGLGTIEPYTSLVALRLLRNWAAKRVFVKFFMSKPDADEEQYADEANNVNPFAVWDTPHHAATALGMKNERGTMTDLWQKAVIMYPGIVAEHGEFSEALFKAMLGLPVSISSSIVTTRDNSNDKEKDSELVFPSSKLVRSMRRCEKKLLPMLDTWRVVDVVLTSNEIVYLEVSDDDCEDVDGAIIETKGGKGLRLCDIVSGRRAIGHLQLSEIESVHVERAMPTETGSGDNEDNLAETAIANKTEYWRQDRPSYDRDAQWNTVKQDVLKIRTQDGLTLCLRFYSDLHDTDAHPEHLAADNEAEGPLFKNNAFQWAQTIIRYCGPVQLKQPLPHFNTSDELRDVLVVKGGPSRGGHRRFLSRSRVEL